MSIVLRLVLVVCFGVISGCSVTHAKVREMQAAAEPAILRDLHADQYLTIVGGGLEVAEGHSSLPTELCELEDVLFCLVSPVLLVVPPHTGQFEYEVDGRRIAVWAHVQRDSNSRDSNLYNTAVLDIQEVGTHTRYYYEFVGGVGLVQMVRLERNEDGIVYPAGVYSLESGAFLSQWKRPGANE